MIEITAAEIDAQVSAWIAANQTGKRRPGVARIAGALGYARLTVRASVERIERAARAAAEPAAHRAYCRNHTLSCTCAEFGRDHVAPLEVFNAPPPAALAAPKSIVEVAAEPATLDCFNRPAVVVTVAGVVYAVRSVDEFGAMHVSTTPTGSVPMPSVVTGIINPGAVPALDVAVYESGAWAFARKPQPAEVVAVTPVTETTAQSLALLEQITAEQDKQRETAALMVDAMLRARGVAPQQVAPMARHLLRLMLVSNPGDVVTTMALAELDRRHPVAYVTVTGVNGATWHLTDADGQPVEAGEHTDADGDKFTIEQHPEFVAGDGHGCQPRSVLIKWTHVSGEEMSATTGAQHWDAGALIRGWGWTPEHRAV